jgi:O-antigen/teichoic acid export membrane protein
MIKRSKADFFNLLSSTALSQIISVLMTPFMAKLYGAEGIGVFAILMGLLAMIQIVATGRYEQAIFLEKRQQRVYELAALCRLLLTISCAICIIILFIVTKTNLFDSRYEKYFGITIAFTFLLYSATNNQVLLSICNRYEMYSEMAKSRLYVSTITACSVLFFGFFNNSPIWLVMSSLFGFAFANLYLGLKVNEPKYKMFDFRYLKRLFIAGRNHKTQPKYVLPADFINVFLYNAPLYFLGGFFGSAVVGNYSLVHRVLNAPIALISSSFTEIFKGKLIKSTDQNSQIIIYQRAYRLLGVIAVIFFIVVVLLSPILIKIFLGKDWELAGRFAQIMALMYSFKLVVSPLSFVIFFKKRQFLDLVLHVGMAIIVSVALLTGCLLKNEIATISFYTLVNIFIYAVYFYLSRRLIYEK